MLRLVFVLLLFWGLVFHHPVSFSLVLLFYAVFLLVVHLGNGNLCSRYVQTWVEKIWVLLMSFCTCLDIFSKAHFFQRSIDKTTLQIILKLWRV